MAASYGLDASRLVHTPELVAKHGPADGHDRGDDTGLSARRCSISWREVRYRELKDMGFSSPASNFAPLRRQEVIDEHAQGEAFLFAKRGERGRRESRPTDRRYRCSAPSGSSHGPKKANLPSIFLTHCPVACGNSGKSLYGLVGLTRVSAVSFVLTVGSMRWKHSGCHNDYLKQAQTRGHPQFAVVLPP